MPHTRTSALVATRPKPRFIAPAELAARLIEADSRATNIGPMLRDVRRELASRDPARFGLRAVARVLDVSPASVSRYENNGRRVPFAYIQSFAALIGTTVDGLIRLANSPDELAAFTPAAVKVAA
jgi:transcriptional regulator with XRE-family HTH domain